MNQQTPKNIFTKARDNLHRKVNLKSLKLGDQQSSSFGSLLKNPNFRKEVDPELLRGLTKARTVKMAEYYDSLRPRVGEPKEDNTLNYPFDRYHIAAHIKDDINEVMECKTGRPIEYNLSLPLIDFYFCDYKEMQQGAAFMDTQYKNTKQLVVDADNQNSDPKVYRSTKNLLSRKKREENEELMNKLNFMPPGDQKDSILKNIYKKEMTEFAEIFLFERDILSIVAAMIQQKKVPGENKSDKIFEAMYKVLAQKSIKDGYDGQTHLKTSNFRYLWDTWRENDDGSYVYHDFSFGKDMPTLINDELQKILNGQADYLSVEELKQFCDLAADSIIEYQKEKNNPSIKN